jgi:hypothetical protein
MKKLKEEIIKNFDERNKKVLFECLNNNKRL